MFTFSYFDNKHIFRMVLYATGQGELILLGGTHPEMEQGMQRGTTPASTQTLNDVVYTISSALPDS